MSKIRDFNTDEEFAAFLEEYEQRHNGDRQRLDAMMLYGQITTCRMRYLLEYFDEEVDSDCGRCDNCRAAQEAAEIRSTDSASALSPNAVTPSSRHSESAWGWRRIRNRIRLRLDSLPSAGHAEFMFVRDMDT